jgi:extradiol dioxygenase family protein
MVDNWNAVETKLANNSVKNRALPTLKAKGKATQVLHLFNYDSFI